MKTKPAVSSLTFGTVTSLLTASHAGAAMVYKTDTPLSVSGSGSFFQQLNWDIDDDTVTDGTINAGGISSPYIAAGGSIKGTASNRLKLARIAGKLTPMTSAGPVGSGYNFVIGPAIFSIYSGSLNSGAFQLLPQTNAYIGFSLLLGGQTHYGWANLSWSTSGLNGVSLTLNSWAYNDTPNESAPVTPVPEPATAALGLAGLALGAAGLCRWRKQKQAA